MTHVQLILYKSILIFLLPGILCFNIHVPSNVIHSPSRLNCGNGTCMFGFSVAQHKPNNGTSWLLVGAPEADLNIAGVKKSGGVYRCVPNKSDSCEIIPFHTKGNSYTSAGEQIDNKSRQWFGSLVRSSGSADVVLACAPRYIWFSPPNYKRREPVGICYTAQNNFIDFNEYSPCSTKKWGYHRQGSCQAGFGADISDDGEYIFIGAVGSWYWQGQVFSQKLNTRIQHRTQESSPSDDDSYLGYSVTMGEFNGDGDQKDIAVGMPRGANLTGKVILYDSNMKNLNNLTGDQIGAYFGYSVSSGDFNGDGLDDIAIGAPMWTDYRVVGQFEVGRVYIVYQNRDNRFLKWSSIDGSNHKARFGLSIICGGNIDLDGIHDGNKIGYQDLIVGAPYDGDDHRGAIYLYLGSEEGIQSKYSQVIFAHEINPSIRTFGWSISAGADLDNNHYPDVLVGAYDSSAAIYLRSAPVIHLNSDLKFLVKSKQINLEEKKCSLRSGRTRVPCIDAQIKLSYHGVGIPNRLRLNLLYILDAKKNRSKRMFFLDDEGQSEKTQSIQILKGHVWTKKFTVYILPSRLHDKLSSLDLKIKYTLDKDEISTSRYIDIPPVISLKNRSVMDSISIKKDCGVDNECIPDLSINSAYPTSYIIGSNEKLQLSTEINNAGEDAFNAYLYITIPKEINYIKTKASIGSSTSVLCSPPNALNNRTLKCEIGNPLPSNSQVKLDIMFQPIEDNSYQIFNSYDFSLHVNSSNPEEGLYMSDNSEEIHINIEVQAQIKLSGTSKPEQVSYNLSGTLPDKYIIEDEIGEEIYHIYDVNNKGPSSIQETDIYIMWPSFTDNGKHSLYLLGIDYDTTLVQCEPIDNINPLYLKTIGSSNYSRYRTELLNSRPKSFDWWKRVPNDDRALNSKSKNSYENQHYIDKDKSESFSIYKTRKYGDNSGAGQEYVNHGSDDLRMHTNTGSQHRQEYQNFDNRIKDGRNQQIESWQKLANGSYIKIFQSPLPDISSSGSQGISFTSISGQNNEYESNDLGDAVIHSNHNYHPNLDESKKNAYSYDNVEFHNQNSVRQNWGSNVDHAVIGTDEQLLYSDNGNWEWSEDINKWKWVGLDRSASNRDHINNEVGGKNKFKRRSLPDDIQSATSGNLYFNPNQGSKAIPQSRSRRSTSREVFNEELKECKLNKCTLIQCRVGPLEKDESVIFKIRSRLFTQSHIEDYQKKVSVSSKILARVTKLPYQTPQQNEDNQYLIDFVTTEVFPMRFGSETVAWWIWILAAIFGILLLLLIIYCLYKCGFFRRKRPDMNPEREPLNSCH